MIPGPAGCSDGVAPTAVIGLGWLPAGVIGEFDTVGATTGGGTTAAGAALAAAATGALRGVAVAAGIGAEVNGDVGAAWLAAVSGTSAARAETAGWAVS